MVISRFLRLDYLSMVIGDHKTNCEFCFSEHTHDSKISLTLFAPCCETDPDSVVRSVIS
jgi:hypothetical protein